MIKRAYGCLIGAAIGDAMGMPASFMTPAQIKSTYGRITGFLPPAEDQIPHGNLTEAMITDDTEETLIIAKVLMENGWFDQTKFIQQMKSWAIRKDMLNTDIIGPSTRRFLEAIISNQDPREGGKTGDTNGAAMRVAPIGIFYHENIDSAIQAAIDSAILSHGSKPGLASAAAIAAAIAISIHGNCTPREVLQAALEGALQGEQIGFDIPAPLISTRLNMAMEVVDHYQNRTLDEISDRLHLLFGASMKSYESIPFSLGVFYAAQGNFEQGLLSAINIGDDADTNGSIVGALCGAYSGAEQIKPEWILKLRTTNQIDFLEIAEKLLKK